MGILDSHPHHTKPTRHARAIIRRMLRPGLVRQHAGVLDAQSAALVHEVHRRDKGLARNPEPGQTRADPGLRVRTGPEHRALLRRLLAARNLREMQALAAEIRHRVRTAIRAAERWRAARKKAAERARAARSWAAGRARSGWERAVPQRGGHDAPAVRKRTAPAADRTRFGTVQPRASRTRFGTPARTRKRGRPAWSRSRAS